MAVTAMSGIVGFAPQYSKSTVVGYTAPTTWFRHKATMVDLAVQDDTRLGAPEIGGVPVPTFPYKAGVLIGGGLTIQPRLESTVGWLLYGAMGNITTSTLNNGVYQHTFTYSSTDQAFVPWMSFRKYIPRKDNQPNTDIGEEYTDCKITGLTFSLPNDAPITARVDVIGRTFSMTDTPEAWSWQNAYEGFASIPIGCQTSGYIKLPTFSSSALPIMAATVAIQNMPIDIRQERVYGSPYIDDVTVIMRQLTFDIIIKWNDAALYRAILTGSNAGTTWTAQPFTSSLDIMAQSPANITGATQPYSLRITCPKAMLAMNQGVQLAGNQAILMRLTGTALEPVAGAYTTIDLCNTASAYDWAMASGSQSPSSSESPSVSESRSASPSSSVSPSPSA